MTGCVCCLLAPLLFLTPSAFPLPRMAPAPFVRATPTRPTSLNLVGSWKTQWRGPSVNFTLKFNQDGTYSDGVSYNGSWSFDARTRTLWVTESSHPEDPRSWCVWKVSLDGKLQGEAEYMLHPDRSQMGQKFAFRLVEKGSP